MTDSSTNSLTDSKLGNGNNSQSATERSRSMPKGGGLSLPKSWKIKKLGEVCEIELGKTPYRKDKPYWDTEKQTNNVWVSIADMQNTKDKFIYDSKEYISNKAVPISKIVKKGTLLLSFKLTIGRLAFAGKDLFTNEAIAALSIKDNKLIDKFYLYNYLLFFDWDKATEGESKVKGKTLNKTKLKELEIIIPPLPEQKRIISILDKVFSVIEQSRNNAEQNLNNAKELFESYLNGIFEKKGDDWEFEKLGKLGKLTSSKRIYKKEYVENGVPFYRSKEIKELGNNKEITLELFITENRYNEIKHKFGVPQKGDVLLTAVGTIGEMYIVKEHDKFYFKDGNIMWLKNFNTLNSYYLKYALTSFVEKLKALSRGAAYSALTIEKLKEYYIPVPSLFEQKQIVQKLDQLQAETKKIEVIYQKKIENLEELKKSILQKAFNGEL